MKNIFKPKDKYELRELILSNVDISTINYSLILDFSELFKGLNFIPDLSKLDTSNVTNMSSMFAYCKNFNQNINHFNTSNVENMSSLFQGCTSFNQPLSNWVTSNVTTMDSMFFDCIIFNQNINNWDVSSVTTLNGMFNACIEFNKPLYYWDVSSVTHMDSTFSHTRKFNHPLDIWDVSNVTHMDFIFSTSNYKHSLKNWNFNKQINPFRIFTELETVFTSIHISVILQELLNRKIINDFQYNSLIIEPTKNINNVKSIFINFYKIPK